MRHSDTWICIADTACARFFCFDGPERGVEPMLDCALGSHTPGAMADGPASFAVTVAGRLDRALEGQLFDNLVLVAPARMLGELKLRLKPATRARVVAEVDRHLTKATPREVEAHVRDSLRH